jgi:hypothetical protein
VRERRWEGGVKKGVENVYECRDQFGAAELAKLLGFPRSRSGLIAKFFWRARIAAGQRLTPEKHEAASPRLAATEPFYPANQP